MADTIEEVRNTVGTMSEDYFNIMDSVTDSYTHELDSYVNIVYTAVQDSENVSTDMLTQFSLQLASLIYLTGSHVEKTGVLDDVSRILRQETYNTAYMEAQKKAEDAKQKLTVNQLNAVAEESAKYHTTMNSIYGRIYKQIKFKLDSALELLSTIKKVISQRMQEVSMDDINDKLAQESEFVGGQDNG